MSIKSIPIPRPQIRVEVKSAKSEKRGDAQSEQIEVTSSASTGQRSDAVDLETSSATSNNRAKDKGETRTENSTVKSADGSYSSTVEREYDANGDLLSTKYQGQTDTGNGQTRRIAAEESAEGSPVWQSRRELKDEDGTHVVKEQSSQSGPGVETVEGSYPNLQGRKVEIAPYTHTSSVDELAQVPAEIQEVQYSQSSRELAGGVTETVESIVDPNLGFESSHESRKDQNGNTIYEQSAKSQTEAVNTELPGFSVAFGYNPQKVLGSLGPLADTQVVTDVRTKDNDGGVSRETNERITEFSSLDGEKRFARLQSEGAADRYLLESRSEDSLSRQVFRQGSLETQLEETHLSEDGVLDTRLYLNLPEHAQKKIDQGATSALKELNIEESLKGEARVSDLEDVVGEKDFKEIQASLLNSGYDISALERDFQGQKVTILDRQVQETHALRDGVLANGQNEASFYDRRVTIIGENQRIVQLVEPQFPGQKWTTLELSPRQLTEQQARVDESRQESPQMAKQVESRNLELGDVKLVHDVTTSTHNTLTSGKQGLEALAETRPSMTGLGRGIDALDLLGNVNSTARNLATGEVYDASLEAANGVLNLGGAVEDLFGEKAGKVLGKAGLASGIYLSAGAAIRLSQKEEGAIYDLFRGAGGLLTAVPIPWAQAIGHGVQAAADVTQASVDYHQSTKIAAPQF